MTVTQPPPLAERWAEAVRRDGSAPVATLSHAQVRAAGLTLAEPPGKGDDSLGTGFQRLPVAEQEAAVERARGGADPAEREMWSYLAAVTASPLSRGTWTETPAWHQPLAASLYCEMFGVTLPDGSAGLLVGDVDLEQSIFSYSVQTVAHQASRLAAGFFAAAPPPPSGVDTNGWTSSDGGGLAQLTLVWPKGRGPRALSWRVTRTREDSPTAFLQTRRDYGMRRSADATVDEQQLAERLQEVLERAAMESSGGH